MSEDEDESSGYRLLSVYPEPGADEPVKSSRKETSANVSVWVPSTDKPVGTYKPGEVDVEGADRPIRIDIDTSPEFHANEILDRVEVLLFVFILVSTPLALTTTWPLHVQVQIGLASAAAVDFFWRRIENTIQSKSDASELEEDLTN